MRRGEPREAWTLADRVLIGASVVALAALLLSASILVVAVALEGWSAMRPASPRTAPIDVAVERDIERIERIGARLIWSEGVVRYWSDLAERHKEASAIACEDLARHAERHRDTRIWAHGGRHGD